MGAMIPRIYRIGVTIGMLAVTLEALGAGRKWG
jgi:hypothetical protein